MADRRAPKLSAGISPQLFAITLILLILAAAGGLYFLAFGIGADPASASGSSDAEAEQVDPFEGLPPELPPSKRKQN